MGSVSGDTRDNHVTSVDVGRAFEALRNSRITAGGQEGFFVSPRRYKDAEKALKSYIKVHEEDDDMDTSALAEELQQVRANVEQAHAEIERRGTVITNMAAEIEASERRLAAEQKAFSALQSKGGDLATLKQLLAEKEKQLGQAKIESKVAGKGYDPVAMDEALARENELRETVRSLQSQRKETERAVSEAKAAVAAESSLRAQLAVDLDKERKEVARLKSVGASAKKEAPIAPIAVELNVPLVRLLVGDKGLKWLSNIDMSRRTNLRDYAYDLLGTANSSKATRGLGDLLAIVLEWLKTKTYNAREAVRPWLVLIEEDLRRAKVRSMQYYRDELARIIGDFKLKSKQQKAKFVGRSTALSTLVSSGYAATQAVKRQVNNLSLWQRTKRTVGKFFSAVSRATKQVYREIFGEAVTGQTLFDIDHPNGEGKVDMVDSESAPPPPPGPPPSRKTGLVARMREKVS